MTATSTDAVSVEHLQAMWDAVGDPDDLPPASGDQQPPPPPPPVKTGIRDGDADEPIIVGYAVKLPGDLPVVTITQAGQTSVLGVDAARALGAALIAAAGSAGVAAQHATYLRGAHSYTDGALSRMFATIAAPQDTNPDEPKT